MAHRTGGEFRFELLDAVRRRVEGRDARPSCDKGAGHGLAYALSGPGDQRDTSGEFGLLHDGSPHST
ncbi:hypothetical protein GCM10018779_04160 [Streptomyces griseocarneus]|nr:hypothetical protein GCM10018779_04160 [Streptomyces griseocarneus]